MRVLVITNVFPATSQTFIDLHCHSLLARGFDIRIVAARGTTNASEELESHLTAVDTVRRNAWVRPLDMLRHAPFDRRTLHLLVIAVSDYLWGRTAGSSRYATAYAKVLKHLSGWDVVHVHFGDIALPIAQLCSAQFIKAKVVVTFHGSDLNIRRTVPNRELYERVFRTASLFTVGTRYMAEHLLNCGVSPSRVRVIPMGVDLDSIAVANRKEKRRSGVSLVSVGRLVEVKGTEYALFAVARIKQKWPDVTLSIVGDGPRRAYLERLATDLQIDKHIRFYGSLAHEQTLRVMGNADILIHPAVVAANGSVEGQGVVLGEAAALGLPVIATRVGGIPEVVVENESALLVEQRDVTGLAECIDTLVANESLRRHMGLAGRRFVERHLDQRRLIEEWINAYRYVLNDEESDPANISN